jgi:hypothetical protein
MSDMNLLDQVCDAQQMEELQLHPWFLLPSAVMYSLLTRILGWSAVAAVFLLLLGGLEMKLFSDEAMDKDNEDDNEKYKKLLTRRK